MMQLRNDKTHALLQIMDYFTSKIDPKKSNCDIC